MQIHIAGKQFDISDRLKSHIEARAEKLTRFYDRIIDCHVTVGHENPQLRRVDLVVHVKGETLKAGGGAEVVYAAVDTAMDKMQRQLKKLHDKRRKPRPPADRPPVEVAEE